MDHAWKGTTTHEQPEKSPRGRNAAADGEGDRHNGPGPFAVRVRKEQPDARTDARDLLAPVGLAECVKCIIKIQVM